MNKRVLPKTLILLGLLIFTVSYYYFHFAILLFLLGSGLLLFVKSASIKEKVIWILAPLLSAIPMSISFLFIFNFIGYHLAPKEIFIFPEQFTGRVKIIESDCGIEVEKKNGIIRYTIPENGILLIKKDKASNFVKHDYYEPYLDTLINFKEKNKQVRVQSGTYGSDNTFLSLYVSDSQSIDPKQYELKRRNFEIKVQSLINQCND